MHTSLFELFKIGIGPSSSHTVGPMRAALRFTQELAGSGQLAAVTRVEVQLFGSLALTGIGHGTDRAVLLGLLGCAPDAVDPETIESRLAEVASTGTLRLLGTHPVPFQPADLRFERDQMYPPPGEPTHPNGLRLRAFDANGSTLRDEVFYSVGGGFIVPAADFHPEAPVASTPRTVPHPFQSAHELLQAAASAGLSIAELILQNEIALLPDPHIRRPATDTHPATPREQIEAGILALFHAMRSSAERGMRTEGILPGGLKVRRRAPRLVARLREREAAAASRRAPGQGTGPGRPDPLAPMDWVTVYAMAVNEENAAGGRVVTAPTNGAAGVIPALALYLLRHLGPADLVEPADLPPWPVDPETGWNAPLPPALRGRLLDYFLTAAAIGILYKENASISGAEVGCQGEVGVACSMAAGGLAAALGGSNEQIEHAAEIAMEHNLGMTCDPIGGLVQIPCIERNGMGAVKAINAARLALADTDTHKLSLDQVIDTMYRTGLDMQSRYKETSLAGLALNVIEC